METADRHRDQFTQDGDRRSEALTGTIKSFWHSLLEDGGLCIVTRLSGPDSAVAFRTTVQIDLDTVTLADFANGGRDEETYARHKESILQAFAPLFTTLQRIQTGAVAGGLLLSALGWVAVLWNAAAGTKLAAILFTWAIPLLLRKVFPKAFPEISRWLTVAALRLYFRYRVKRLVLPGNT